MESSMLAMDGFMNLFYEWEIQLLVLFSFTLQLFLFFAGSLRRHSTSGFVKLTIWIAYLGADLVAVYGLGYLSRYDDITIERHIVRRTESLAFFWAPFLLIHLGGQDTITAFSMEDNNLWLRHLLNLFTQVVLALYVFWKSIGRHTVDLLVSGIFVFVCGIIKYGERTWSLNCGSLKSFESSTGDQYLKQMPKEIFGSTAYSRIVCVALRSMPFVHGIFSARNLFDTSPLFEDYTIRDANKTLTVVRLQLGMMYEDLYTKTLVLRTRSVIILRCISQISAIVAFVLFQAMNKRRYGKADIAITYSLFTGGFFLEACAVFISMMSPWTWAWLKARKCNALARLSWFIFSSDIGWPEEKQRWPKSMGQYNFRCWLPDSYKARTCSQRVMTMVRRFANWVGVGNKQLFWMSKLLDTEQVDVGTMMMGYVAAEVSLLHDEFYFGPEYKGPRAWPKLGLLLERTQASLVTDFGQAIVFMHKLTEVHLSKYPQPASDMVEANAASTDIPFGIVETCRKLSNYMMYLLVANPSMLPLPISSQATLESSQRPQALNLLTIEETLDELDLQADRETLEEIGSLWMRFLLYAAGKSRVEMHLTQLSSGGELITFIWLLMAHYGIGESLVRRIRITNDVTTGNADVREVYAFYVPEQNHQPRAHM